MMSGRFFWWASLCVLPACQSPAPSGDWQTLAGRYQMQLADRPVLYRVLVPGYWIRQPDIPPEMTKDTTQPIGEFRFCDHEGDIRLTIHTFPITDRRVPLEAQLTRWKKQFDQLNPASIHTWNESHGGFSGVYLEAEGLLKGQEVALITCAMQLAALYLQPLDGSPLEASKMADYTIKAEGPPAAIRKHRAVLLAFMRSFELIDEWPAPCG